MKAFLWTGHISRQYRDYLTEAYLIASGESRLLPERAHIEALIRHIDKIQSAIDNLTEVSK